MGIDVGPSEDVAEERTGRFGVAGIDERVHSGDHVARHYVGAATGVALLVPPGRRDGPGDAATSLRVRAWLRWVT